MVTIAPELPGALEVIEALVGRGVVVSIGHTAATDVSAAVTAGATCFTHLFNAMPPLHHRLPGPVGAALDGSLVASVLVDGHHLDPAVVRLAWRLLGPSRFLSVSDTTAGLGLRGAARLGDQDVTVADGTVRLPDGTLAGTAASLLDCLRELLRVTGCSLDDALATATTTPAAVLGLVPRAGDRVLLTPSLQVVTTAVGGQVVYDGREG
jgi:N-acetylglucosamine-6-phosphate deacetylase